MNCNGGPGGARTHDLRVANAALSQLSYKPIPTERKYIINSAVCQWILCKIICFFRFFAGFTRYRGAAPPPCSVDKPRNMWYTVSETFLRRSAVLCDCRHFCRFLHLDQTAFGYILPHALGKPERNPACADPRRIASGSRGTDCGARLVQTGRQEFRKLRAFGSPGGDCGSSRHKRVFSVPSRSLIGRMLFGCKIRFIL